ncbi:hypothetical protein P3X46_035100 [Hevea brasiliensis]|uniref:NB-ARC domain-containing protein n=1 Tax=Hevea brasiliensis TaxID=3981 RepID=A0ABQ9KC90_HEVBR|nr:putative disease resistance protein At3g14460 [Hevea brasiliensis]KAJ9131442.1 hypothetical protein P3X46_035100 [Hevea brasiliensis]
MDVVGEVVLSTFLEGVLDKLLSLDFLNFIRGGELNKPLEKLKLILPFVATVVNDAEEKRFEKPVNGAWLKQLKHVVYDAEDVLDEIAFKAMEDQLEPKSQINRKVWDVFSKCRKIISDTVCGFKEGTESKINRIVDTLEYLVNQKDVIGLSDTVGGSSSRAGQRLETTSLLSEPRVFGRNDDREKIIRMLVSDENVSSNGVCVIPIVGMGGVGKTTLAQFVYNDHMVKEHFDLKVWVCVSDRFDVKKLTKTILESISPDTRVANDLNSLQVNLQEKLSGKKFLLILDDVWNEDYDQWIAFRKPFITGLQVSKILITTRNVGVSSIMRTVPDHYVEQLPEEDCWSLLRQHAFENESSINPQLEFIGKKIVRKCKGLPLAVSIIGGLLRSKTNIDNWEDLLNSKFWSISDSRGILPALSLSYLHLPAALKQCFVYCSIFPKDYEFKVDELVLLWMAEGFIPQLKGVRLEDMARRYFLDLLSRSFFQHSVTCKSGFKMHDLVHDLSKSLSEGMCFRMEDMFEAEQHYPIPENARHLSYVPDYYEPFTKFGALGKTETSLRTFLPLGRGRRFSYLPEMALLELLQKLNRIRVFSLNGYQIVSLPESIGNLRHLRYLDLSYTSIRNLPESTGTLYNLQTLLLIGCQSLIELPTNMGKLLNLQYLDASQSGLMKMPHGIGRLIKLQRLSNFIIGKNNETGIRELRDLSLLQGSLIISGLQNVLDPLEAIEARFEKKHYLSALVLEWSRDIHTLAKGGSAEKLLNILLSNMKLKDLMVRYYSGKILLEPASGFVALEKLTIEECDKLTSVQRLQSTGIFEKETSLFPCLHELSIKHCPKLRNLPKHLPSLVQLKITGCMELVELFPEKGEEMQCLTEISIQKCPKLRKLPTKLPSLVQLNIDGCLQLHALPTCSLIRNLRLQECNEMLLRKAVGLHSLTSLYLCKIQKLRCLPKGALEQLMMLEDLEIHSCDLLRLSSDEVSLQNLVSLRRLAISDCPQMEHFPCQLHTLTTLKKMEIWACPRLRLSTNTRLPSLIQDIWISCDAKSLPLEMICCSSLERLSVWNSHCLTSLPGCKLSSSLKMLTIRMCSKLEFLPKEMMHCNSSLESLLIESCESLQSLGLQAFTPDTATSLKELKVIGCGNLKSFPEGLHNLTSLCSLTIISCPGLVSFPDGGFPVANLRKIQISQCYELRSLPVHGVSSLQDLTMRRCPNLYSFPEGPLPAKLERLLIDSCGNLNSISRWGFERLACLKNLSFIGCSTDREVFMEGFLPSTLVTLSIKNLPTLKVFDKGLQHLNSLKYLRIVRCHSLSALPEEMLPANLCFLQIVECPSVKRHYEINKRNGIQQYSRISCLCWEEDF